MTDDDLEARRARLRADIDAYEEKERATSQRGRDASSLSGYAAAFRLSTEFVSAVVVGGGLGWLLDWALGTLPLFFVILLLVGFAAGVLNVLRSAGLISEPQAGKRRPD